MTDSQVIDKDVLIDTLTSIAAVRDMTLLEGTTDQYKIFWEHVPADVALPYIVVSHIMGGRYQGTDVSQAYSDSVWKVVVHTADILNAEDYANAIATLQNMCPVCTRYTGLSAVTTLQQTMPVFDRYQVQNVPQFVIGGLYRVRLNLGAN